MLAKTSTPWKCDLRAAAGILIGYSHGKAYYLLIDNCGTVVVHQTSRLLSRKNGRISMWMM